jgi:chromosome segregation ATPase
MANQFDPDKGHSDVHGSTCIRYVQDGIQYDHEMNEIVPDQAGDARQTKARITNSIVAKQTEIQRLGQVIVQKINKVDALKQEVIQAQDAVKVAEQNETDAAHQLDDLNKTLEECDTLISKLDKPVTKSAKPAPKSPVKPATKSAAKPAASKPADVPPPPS